MPWAMVLGKPKAFAPTLETWIGFLSPLASAYAEIVSWVTRTKAGLAAGSPAALTAESAAAGSPSVLAPLPRKPETCRQTTSSPSAGMVTSVTMSMSMPARWARGFSARTRMSSASPTCSGRVCSMALVRWTTPTAPKGKPFEFITLMASGNAST